MKRKLLIMLLCGCLIFDLSSFSSHLANNTNLSTITDTTSYTQEEYLELVEPTTNTLMSIPSNDEKVKLTCELFLAIAKASVRKPDEYDPTVIISSNCLNKDTIQYRLTDYNYQSKLNEVLEQNISDDTLEFTNFDVTYKDSKATANIVESYTYYSNDGFDDISFRRKMYTFNLDNVDNNWLITDVKTDDPWELESDFEYNPIDVDACILDKTNQKEIILDNRDKDSDPTIDSTLYVWSYNKTAAVNYAKKHYNDTSSSDSIFGFNSGRDCQNFASQCVWAGLGGSGSSTRNRPAVSTSIAGSSSFNVWCRNQHTTFYPEFYFNWPWDNARGFMKLMKESKKTTEGPYGNAYYSNGVQNSYVGDVLCVNWNGRPNEHSMNHAMFVTMVSGTYGSRTKNDVKIAAHTSATNSAYQRLSSYTQASINNFGKSVIWRGYYKVKQ